MSRAHFTHLRGILDVHKYNDRKSLTRCSRCGCIFFATNINQASLLFFNFTKTGVAQVFSRRVASDCLSGKLEQQKVDVGKVWRRDSFTAFKELREE